MIEINWLPLFTDLVPFGHSKVDEPNLGTTFVDQDVAWFYISMMHPVLMTFAHSSPNLRYKQPIGGVLAASLTRRTITCFIKMIKTVGCYLKIKKYRKEKRKTLIFD